VNRIEAVAMALAYQGVSVSTHRAEYIGLVGPGESPSMQRYMCDPRTSGCALVVRGIWRAAGVQHPILALPYKIGMAVADVVSIARAHDAWHWGAERRPEPGDVVLVGGGQDGGGAEHVYTVVDVAGDSITSIDGGQRDGRGQQCILEKYRRWETDEHGVTWDRVQAGTDPGAGSRRRVRGTCDVSKLPVEDVYEEAPDTDPEPPLVA
jgi:hypothetical protein